MKHLLKVLTFVPILAVSSTLAYASPLAGSVTINSATRIVGPSHVTGTTKAITFTSDSESASGSTRESGSDLTSMLLPGYPAIELASFVSTFTIPNTSGASFAGETLFTYQSDGLPGDFTVTSATLGPNGSLIFFGSLTGGTSASYLLTPVSSPAPHGSFTGTLSVASTPEPSSLLLLGTGLAGAGLIFRRRRPSTKS